MAVNTPLPLPSVGILAATGPGGDLSLKSTTDPVAITYTVYLTAAEAQATTIDYAVTTPGADYLDASALVAGTGSGSVTIAAGQTSAQITVDVLANALGSLPEADLQVSVTPTGGETVYGGSAQVEIVNPAATAGTPAQVLLTNLRATAR